MDKIETVENDCKHQDCVYRRKFDVAGREYCAFAEYQHMARGCSISECTRYARGRLVKMSTLGGLRAWIVEEEEEDVISVGDSV